jgi:phage head maturation protease
MPLPEPQKGESEEVFVASCMSNDLMKKEFSDQKQRLAVCYSQYRKGKGLGVSEPIPILRAFESGGAKYIAGYAAIFDSEDSYGTAMTKEAVESSQARLQTFPAVRFMHRTPFGQIDFENVVQFQGNDYRTSIDDHGFHVLCRVYDQCENEWNMVKAGKWGFSYGFMPDAEGGIQSRKLANGHTVPCFVKGSFYEVSVVDAPAHEDAVAYVVSRMVYGDTGEIITKGANKMPEDKKEGIGNKEEFERLMKEAEIRITADVTKVLEAKRSQTSFETSLKQMEERLMDAVEKKLAAQVPEKSRVEQTFESVNTKLAGIDAKIATLKEIERKLKSAGENYAELTERIAAYEKQRDSFVNSVTETVTKSVEKQLIGVQDRLSAIEGIPELRSPATSGERSGVERGMGFGAMLEASRKGTRQ